MLFNSIDFLVFLPIVVLGAAALSLPWKNRFLLVASYYFYGCWDWRFLGLIFLTTVMDYTVGRILDAERDPAKRKGWLLAVVCVNLGILGFFKYFNFFVGSAVALLDSLGLHASAPALQVILPVGVSFYTFQSMAYVVDIYRGQLKPATNFLDYALFVSYFPQLVAGPINRAGYLVPQILAPASIDPARLNAAVTLLVIGFAKKVLIADSIAPEVDRIFAHPDAMSSGELIRGAYLFTLQIYGDFSGYTDIARGVSALLGIDLVVNFNQPYLSRTITEFWRCWHISLSTWLRDYLYIPLGGNRHGRWRTYRNLMLTMLIGGLWHGANWTFVIWGGLHGGLLALERALGIEVKAAPATLWGFVRAAARLSATFHLAVFCWIFFRAADLASAVAYIRGIAPLSELGDVGWLPLAMGFALLCIDLPQRLTHEHTALLRIPWWIRSPVFASVCFLTLGKLIWGGGETPFIYFQF